jgi:hypothetical protein
MFGILAGGAAFAAVETSQELTTWRGAYSAITHDHHHGLRPHRSKSLAGQVLVVLVTLVGIAYFAILTGAMAQQFLAAAVDEDLEPVEDETLRLLGELGARLARLEAKLDDRYRPQPSYLLYSSPAVNIAARASISAVACDRTSAGARGRGNGFTNA